MNRFFTQMYLKLLLILSLVLLHSSAHQNFNSYDDYDEQGNYNDQHPLTFYSSHNRDDTYERHRSYQPKNDDENFNHRNYESILTEQTLNNEEEYYPTDTRQNQPRIYQPHPAQPPPPPPQDPNVIVVPQLGLVRGKNNYKTIKNRPISAYLGLKYGQVKKGLGRFQVNLHTYINSRITN